MKKEGQGQAVLMQLVRSCAPLLSKRLVMRLESSEIRDFANSTAKALSNFYLVINKLEWKTYVCSC